MVGNLWEWVAWWGESDMTWSVNGSAHNGTAYSQGLPAAALRGGDWSHGADAGVFAVYLDAGPSNWDYSIGFRCCRGR